MSIKKGIFFTKIFLFNISWDVKTQFTNSLSADYVYGKLEAF